MDSFSDDSFNTPNIGAHVPFSVFELVLLASFAKDLE